MSAIRPNVARSKTAILLIWLFTVVVLVSGVNAWIQHSLVERILDGEFVTTEEIQWNAIRTLVVAVVVLVVRVLSIVFFIMWFRRAYFNLSQKTKLTSYSDGWAAGSWFVPILNLFRPYQIMSELYTITPDVYRKHGIKPETELIKGNIALWWTIWIITNVLSSISNRMAMFNQSAASIKVGFFFTIAICVLFIPLAIITVKVIKDYTIYAEQLKEIGDERHFEAFVDDKLYF